MGIALLNWFWGIKNPVTGGLRGIYELYKILLLQYKRFSAYYKQLRSSSAIIPKNTYVCLTISHEHQVKAIS